MGNFTDEIKQKLKNREKELQILASRQFQKDFLTMTGYKIGDIVKCHFATYHGTSKQAYHSSVDAEGEIVQDENGDIYVKSLKQYNRAYTMDNGRTGRSRRDWWAYELEFKRSELMHILKTENQ